MRTTAIVTMILLGLAFVIPAGLIASDLPVQRDISESGGQGKIGAGNPPVILQMGDTTWIQVHTDGSHCPGDTAGGHGGEATGGPDGSETWCFEGGGGAGDPCGSLAPYDLNCFTHVDMHLQP